VAVRRWWIVALVVAATMVTAGCGKSSSTAKAPGGKASTTTKATPKARRPQPRLPKGACKGTPSPARYDHVVVVVMENHKWSDVLNGQAPWLTARMKECQTATNYVQAGSPSRPNYIAMVAGSTFGCEGSNADPPGGCAPPSPSLFKQVIDAGGTAKNYLGGAQAACDQTSGDKYAVKHAPWPYFTGERALCTANAPAVGSSGFLDPKHLPTLAYISPDLCDDTHDCSVAEGDRYLRTLLSPILTSSSYLSGKTAVLVTYDEYTPLPNVLMAKSVRRGTVGSEVTHTTFLHTIEAMLGLRMLNGQGDLRSATGL